ncbi:hypothetical protein PVAG01_10500 [Phlyctema vagabunda]|uniref:AB hydrolase-1 domain-containing protein n=1 Tax=Phlyctema vagabunda TaxID=108571 RepID=A0ABR4P2G8_9HELO
MDWNSTVENGSRVAVAIIKIPAKVPVTDKRYGGAILLNPGGPGGSGVSIVFRLGERIQRVVDAAVDPTKLDGKIGDKYFDILSFDPRGVNNTTPQLICFPDSYSAQSWAQALSTEGTVGSSEIAFATKWARYVAVTGSCTERMDAVSRGGENLLEHMNTAPVVADMVAIIEALGEWREKEALRLLDSPVESDMSIGAPSKYASSQSQDVLKSMDYTQSRADIIERTKWNKGHEKLLYWGLSYGSVLGATFAAMQPHRVERVIIDGVVDGEDYYSAEFKLNLNDAEDVFSQFFHFCATAGPSACPFADQGETAEMLRKKFDSILAELINQPISVLPNSEKDFSIPDIITSSDLLRYIHRSLYSPLKLWPDLAKILHELQHRNGTSFTTIRNESRSSKRNDRCPACDEPYSAGCQGSTLGDDLEISFAIWCTDGAPAQLAPEEFKNTTLKHLRNQSIHFGDIWSELRMQCVGWKVRPKWNYKGTFRGIETSYPLLIIGTTGDPVCPMVK